MIFKDLQTIHNILSKEEQYSCSIKLNDNEEITFTKNSQKGDNSKNDRTIGFKA